MISMLAEGRKDEEQGRRASRAAAFRGRSRRETLVALLADLHARITMLLSI